MTMKTTHLLLAVSSLSLLAMTPVLAQDITGVQDLDDRITDIEEDVAEDMDRSNDAARFGFPEYQPGFSGNASLGYAAETGNTESQEFNLGMRLRYAEGNWVQTLGIAADFAEDAGVKTKEDIFAVYDANYYLNDRFYLFGLARVERDGLAVAADQIGRDAFIGFGPGYRVINTPDMAWRLQAGVGVSYLENGLGQSETEEGYLASSRFFYQISDAVFLTNDTDILSSDTALRANNDLGVNFKVTDTLSTRISYLTDFNDARAIETDNRLGVSLVVGF
jgi:putative salt-induced outer membrane protein